MRPRGVLVLLALMLGLLAATPAVGQASPPPVLHADGATLKWMPAGTQDESNQPPEGDEPPPEQSEQTPEEGEPSPGESEPARKAGEPPRGDSEQPLEEYEQLPEGGELPRAGAAPTAEATGRPKYRLDAATYFDRFGVAQYAGWVKAKISVIKGYPPFSDKYVGLFGLPLIGYHDPATEGQAPLGPAGIEAYVARVRRDMSLGYAGVFLDDANWSARFPPSPGPRSALANLLVAIRAAEPTAVIEMNSQYHDIWPLMKAHDPDVERALRVVNIVTKEFGVGPTAAINTAQDYGELLQFIDALHAKGVHVTMTGDRYSNTVPTMEYNLATYLLANDGGDLVNGDNQTPAHWWPGFNVNLGQVITKRERSPTGLWKRVFSGGIVYAVEPGASRQTIRLGRPMHSAQRGTVQSVTLSAGQGAVLVG
ncbi:MAG: hypothetical protein ACHQAV_06650 [Solirubrobacterales bacterium]